MTRIFDSPAGILALFAVILIVTGVFFVIDLYDLPGAWLSPWMFIIGPIVLGLALAYGLLVTRRRRRSERDPRAR